MYPCILQDENSGYWFIAESTGPRSWRYHRTWLRAWFELNTGW